MGDDLELAASAHDRLRGYKYAAQVQYGAAKTSQRLPQNNTSSNSTRLAHSITMPVITLKAFNVALTLASLTSAGTLELVRWVAPGNPSFTTCSPYVTDVYGCTGWGENFCQSNTGGADCRDCTGIKSTSACGSATVTMNFDTGEISFANNPGDTASCSFGASNIGYPDGSICTV